MSEKSQKMTPEVIELTPEQQAIAFEFASGIDAVENFLVQGEEDLNDKKLSAKEAIELAIEAPATWNGVKRIVSAVRSSRKFTPAEKAAIRAKAAEMTASPSNDPTRVSLVIDYASEMYLIVDKIISKTQKLGKSLKALDNASAVAPAATA